MRIQRNVLLVGVCGLAVGLLAWAQGRKAGLWEVISTMSWQQSGFPAGMAAPMNRPHTMRVCVSQEQIDKYGTVPPQTRGDCQVANIVRKPNGMTAKMVCTGPLAGKGDIESSWTDDSHSTSRSHFLGTMRMGQDSRPIEWTLESTFVYKGPDCGNVKPIETP
ncbi:MAG TPA: DUF3617 family protein [Terracidiphilus sp.]